MIVVLNHIVQQANFDIYSHLLALDAMLAALLTATEPL